MDTPNTSSRSSGGGGIGGRMKKNKLATVAIAGGAAFLYLSKKGSGGSADAPVLLSPASAVSVPDENGTFNEAAMQQYGDFAEARAEEKFALDSAAQQATIDSAASAQESTQTITETKAENSPDAGAVPPSSAGQTPTPQEKTAPPPMQPAPLPIAALPAAYNPPSDKAFLASIGITNPPPNAVKPIPTSAPPAGSLQPILTPSALPHPSTPTMTPAASHPTMTASGPGIPAAAKPPVKTRTVGGKKQWFWNGNWHTVPPQ